MRVLPAAVAALALAAPAAADPAATSWGKAGITFDQYRADAVACATRGYYLDVSHTEAARVLADASRKLDTISETGVPDSGNQQSEFFPSAGAAAGSTLDKSYDPAIARSLEQADRMARVVQVARPDLQVKRTGQLMRSTVEQCLTALGYQRFQLTLEQQRNLGKLRRGTEARKAYLFSLASDPEVLAAQRTD